MITIQVVQRGSAGARVPAVRSSPTAPAAATASELREREISTLSRAFILLGEAATCFDLDRARSAYSRAANLLVVDDSIDEVVVAARALLSKGSKAATRLQVAKAVANLVGAYPNFQKAEARLFGATLAEDVAAAEPTAMALEIMVRQVRRTSKFVPTISEVLEAVADAERVIERGWDAVERIAQCWEDARAKIDHLRQQRACWLDDQVAEYRRLLQDGGDVRNFDPEVITIATTREEDRCPY